jgi:hypothetical protein
MNFFSNVTTSAKLIFKDILKQRKSVKIGRLQLQLSDRCDIKTVIVTLYTPYGSTRGKERRERERER